MGRMRRAAVLLAVAALSTAILAPAAAGPGGTPGPPDDKPGGGHTEGYGNNLSFPVIWSEGVEKTLRGTPGMTPVTGGEWWYWWGTTGEDPNVVPLSCPPDPDRPEGVDRCDDGIPGQAEGEEPGSPLYRAYLQKDALNEWQAGTLDASADRLEVDWLDWGDNLESVDWTTNSQVRTEVVLYQDLAEPMRAYEMLHTSGWGIDEVHGLAELAGEVQEYSSSQATVYSPCARLAIQLLLVPREELPDVGLDWDDEAGEWTGEGLVNPAIFNKTVWDAGDGPGYYSAEINVKGKVIYGYTWSVRKLHDTALDVKGAGDYRITFYLDDACPYGLNTYFADAEGNPVTELILPVEEIEAATESEDGGDTGGAEATILHAENMTYIDVRILGRSNGGGGGGGGGSGGGGGGGGRGGPK